MRLTPVAEQFCQRTRTLRASLGEAMKEAADLHLGAMGVLRVGVSPLYADRVWEQTQRIRELGVGLLVVEQNAQAAVEHADTVFVLAQGRNVLSGEAEEVILTVSRMDAEKRSNPGSCWST